MNKNTIYNIIIGLCLTSGLYNLSACIFNPMGTTDGHIPSTTTSTEAHSTNEISTSEIIQTNTTISPTSLETLDGTTTTTSGLTTDSTTNEILTSSTTITSTTNEITSSSSTTEMSSECGNNIIELNEECDGSDLGNNKCENFGLPENNMLFCNRDCTFNTTKCGTCGNCVLELDEECDPCLFEMTDGAYCESEETDFGKCVIKFTKPVLYAHTNMNNGQMITSELDKEEADALCKIYNRDMDSLATNWNKNIKGWPKNYNYFNHFTLGLDEAIPLISTAEILFDYEFYYIDSDHLNPNLDPAQTQFQFSCQ